MTISSSLNASVAGLSANASRLATISDNIANSATHGYRRVKTDFHSMVISTQGGTYSAGGVRTTNQRMIDQGGALISTANATDLAVRGRGFLPVARSSDVAIANGDATMLLATTGSFRTDSEGYLTTESGLVLMGWPAMPDRHKDPTQARTITNVFPQRADAPNPLPVTNGTADNIFRKSPIAVSGTSKQGTYLRGGIRPPERDVTVLQITKRDSKRPLTILQAPTSHAIASRSNGPVQPIETIIPDNIAALADDPNDLARTILRDLGPVQHTSQTQDRPPIITQMAHALPQNAPQTRETYHVDLTPKDLGSVRMSLIPHDGGITITIQCDVDSTAQLARRHSDHLVRDLMDMGYASVDIDVADQRTNNHDSNPSHALANNQVDFDTHDNDDLSTQQDQISPYHPASRPDGIDIKV